MRVSYTLAGLEVLVHSECRLAVTDERAVAENYNFIPRFSACVCLVAVCLCCSFVVHCQRGVHYSFPILGAGIRYMIQFKECL